MKKNKHHNKDTAYAGALSVRSLSYDQFNTNGASVMSVGSAYVPSDVLAIAMADDVGTLSTPAAKYTHG